MTGFLGERTLSRQWMAVLGLIPMIWLAGCSGGGSSNPLSGLPTGHTNVSGTAFDGYLIGARVCADLNLNKSCDSSEPSTLTGLDGKFTLNGLTDTEAKFPLVLEATPSTVDSETGAVDPNVKFLAPPGSTVINPFTTIIQMKVEEAVAAGSYSTLSALKAQAAAQLAAQLGVTVDLTKYDPIKAKNDTSLSSSERRTAAQLSLASKVLTDQIATLVPQAESLANGDNTAAFGASINKLDPVDVFTAVQNDTSGLALVDLIQATSSQVTTETPPAVPTTAEIQAQATQDATYNSTVSSGFNSNITGATGGTVI